jgi:hypothetical protein
MNAYQGLFYLVSGFSAYFGVLAILRSISSSDLNTISVDSKEWKSKEELIIIDIIQETHDVKTFRFKRINGDDFDLCF